MGAVITKAVKLLDDDKKPQRRPVIPGEVEKTIALGRFLFSEKSDIFQLWLDGVFLTKSYLCPWLQHAPVSFATKRRPSSTCTACLKTVTGSSPRTNTKNKNSIEIKKQQASIATELRSALHTTNTKSPGILYLHSVQSKRKKCMPLSC